MKKVQLVVRTEDLNSLWSYLIETGNITVPSVPLISDQSRIFTMGSCFAVEIRKVLKSRKLAVYPQYNNISIDKSKFVIGDLPERENINYYNTFSIEQEFARAVGLWEQSPQDYWEVEDSWWDTQGVVYQDPYRRSVFGKTLTDIQLATRLNSETLLDGMKKADVFLITLGLIEVWRKKDDGRIACMHPGYNGGGGHDQLEFSLSSFNENRENLEKIVSHIGKINSNANIVFTVSPVPLGSTFTGGDVFIANMESKSVLRAAAAEVCRAHANVHYFQSYDICHAIGNPFLEDGRHVKPEIVKLIVSCFMAAFGKRSA